MIFEGEGGPDPLSPPPLDPHLIWSLIGKNLLVLAKLIFYVVSVAEQTGLVITFPETPNSHIRKDAS